VIRGVIDRRILVNYRVDPAVLAPALPPPFRPKLHRGHGVVGICLIRLRGGRPRFLPSWLGISSENAAHRTAVEWDEGGRVREGVYVRRRDTNSWLDALAGGRVFPGIHSRARFTVRESGTHFEVALRGEDGVTSLAVVRDVAAREGVKRRFEARKDAQIIGGPMFVLFGGIANTVGVAMLAKARNGR
jgi:hypothetical protein